MSEAAAAAERWLLLVHQLPAKPAYVRVKVWRRLQALGAVTVKNSVYALPAGDQAQEDFEWLLKEIGGSGGEGIICEARLVDGMSDDDVRSLFNKARRQDYNEVGKEARALHADAQAGTQSGAELRSRVLRIRTELERIAAIDFFGADGRETVEGFLSAVEINLREEEIMPETNHSPASGTVDRDALTGRIWVTRKGVHVDRIASAWLIKRFIDPNASFKFVPAKGYIPEPHEFRFDMYEGEFTHEGDNCTFEVLLVRTGIADQALTAISEIVHDIDLKDTKFARMEAGGIASIIDSIAAAHRHDEQRLARGAAIFDDLYELFRRKR